MDRRVTDVDWRLDHGADELIGRAFRFGRWWPYRDGWDHDHCQFCFSEISADETGHADHNAGWVTAEDAYFWVCVGCFDDFRERFKWSVAA